MGTPTIELHQPGLLAAIKDLEAMGLWECLRRARRPLTAGELAKRTSRGLAAVHAALDLLARAGLVAVKKARGPRRTVGYAVTVPELSIVIDPEDRTHRRVVDDVAAYVKRELPDSIFRTRKPIGPSGPETWHFHHCSPLTLGDDDLTELKRRIARVEEFVRLLGDRQASGTGGLPQRCNHGILIRIEPLDGHVLPQPNVEFVSTRTVAERGTVRGIAHERLTPRERQVARSLRDGQRRAEVARRLGISPLTVDTLCKRIFRKLGIRRAAQLHGFDLR